MVENKWREKYDLVDVELKICPFCGSNNLDKNTTNENAYWIECKECTGQTMHGISWEEAVDNWNERVETLPKEIE